jgi:hypothetical protein
MVDDAVVTSSMMENTDQPRGQEVVVGVSGWSSRLGLSRLDVSRSGQ